MWHTYEKDLGLTSGWKFAPFAGVNPASQFGNMHEICIWQVFVMVLKNQQMNTNTDYRYIKCIVLDDESWTNDQTKKIILCFPQHKVKIKILKIFDTLELKFFSWWVILVFHNVFECWVHFVISTQ